MYQIFDWAGFGTYVVLPFGICNPVTNRCVGDPTVSNPCNAGGGQIYFNSIGAVNGLTHIGLPLTMPHTYGQLYNQANTHNWDWLYQGQQSLKPTSLFRSDDLFYSNTYAAFADDWKVGIKIVMGSWSITIKLLNTTKDKIANHATSNSWAWPQLPLIWQLVNGRGPGSTVWFDPKDAKYGHQAWYSELFDYSPFCGSHSYAAYSPWFRHTNPSKDIGMDEDYVGQNGWQWSCGNRLQDFSKRGEDDNSDFNNLDYMVLWNLNAIIDGKRAISSMFNPYYKENFAVSFPFYYPFSGSTLGTNTRKLKLNFLEYLSMINKINPGGYLKVRCAKVVDLKPGFETLSGGVFDAMVRDYSCQTEGYVYALVNEQPSGYSAPGSDSTVGAEDSNYIPLDFPPDGVPMHIEQDSNRLFNNYDSSAGLTEEQEYAYMDSLIALVYAAGDSTAIAAIQPLVTFRNAGNNQTRMQQAQALNFSVFPNPSNGSFYVQKNSDEKYRIEIFNSFGQMVFSGNQTDTYNKFYDLKGVLTAGVYSVVVYCAQSKTVHKLIVVK
ncbi:MAG: T9SS type A sorting domain-containing protein [Bacteroidetes bacterium]|nr:T9SS type A sorting domain-containing protein [Bacteroidota bacterium]